MHIKEGLTNLIENVLPVYAVDNITKIRASSIVKKVDGLLEVASLEKDVIPSQDSCVLHVSSLMSAAGPQPVIYLGLQVGRTLLGRVRIRLTCGPRRRDQMLRLCVAQNGLGWKGSTFVYAFNVGQAGEHIVCCDYIDKFGNKCRYAIAEDIEQDECEWAVEGVVTGDDYIPSFTICTRSNPTEKGLYLVPEVGRVVSGLEILRQALRQYKESEIQITETGVEISA